MRRKSQSVAEYAMLVIIVSAAIGAMTVYIQRAMNNRFSQVKSELWEPAPEE